MNKDSKMRRYALWGNVGILLLSVLIIGFVFANLNTYSAYEFGNVLVSLIVMIVNMVFGVFRLVGIIRNRPNKKGVKFSLSMLIANIFMISSILTGVYLMVLGAMGTVSVLVYLLLAVAILNVVVVRITVLNNNVSMLSKLFTFGKDVNVNLMGHRYSIVYIGVFMASTLSGIFSWISISRDSDSALAIFYVLPCVLFVTLFLIMTVMVGADILAGKLCVGEYRKVSEMVEEEEREI